MRKYILLFAVLFAACHNDVEKAKTDSTQQVDNNTAKVTSSHTESAAPEPKSSNPFIGKYFYICASMDSDFENFFEKKDDFYFVFYFKDKQTLIYYANINGWQPGIVGRYKYENNQIVMNVSNFFSGQPRGENFGGDVKIINSKQIEVFVSGSPRYKLLHFTPQ